MPFVADNSVVSGWYLAKQATPYTDAVLDRLRIDTAIVPPERVLSLAITHDLTAYDAAYLELSLRLKLPIAAKDGALRGAAEKAGVGLVQDMKRI